jgi:Flp pilus assembly protein TadB
MVSTSVALGLVLWTGLSPLPLLATVAALRFPLAALIGVTAWIVVWRFLADRGPSPDDEARFLSDVVTELHGGASPRVAVIRASAREESIDARLATRAALLGLDSARLATGLTGALPINGRLAGAAWAISTDSGAPFGPVMRLLAHRAAERGRLLRERRALTAQARATAWLVAGVPLGLFALLVATGRIDTGPSLPIAAVGLSLQVVGVAVVVLMLRGRS